MVYKTLHSKSPSQMQPQIANLFNGRLIRLHGATALRGLLIGALVALGLPGGARAQTVPQQVPKAPIVAPQAVPGFWDPRRRPDRPDLSRLTVIRFLTETDYPPFNFTGPDGNPAGFNVDLARALCDEIKVTCTIQMRRFETLLDALASNRGDAVIASLAVTPELRKRVDLTDPYYRTPARFVSRRDAVMPVYRVYAKKVPLKDGDYSMDHTALIYLMDRDGHFVSPFNLNRKPEAAAEDLKRYL